MFQINSASRLTLVSFFTVILVGATLIYFTEYSRNLPYIDALFTATTATCVTGLITTNFSEFTFIGQLITLLLIQIGGISVIVFFRLIWFGRTNKIKFFSHQLVSQAVDVHGESKGVLYFLISTIKITLFIETLGAICLFLSFDEISYLPERIWTSIFIAISAFNNAGISVYPDNLSQFMFKDLNILIISSLIVLGGIGYPVIIGIERLVLRILVKITSYLSVLIETLVMKKPEIVDYFQFIYTVTDKLQSSLNESTQEIKGHATNVQLKIVIIGTLVLLVLGTIVFYILETSYGNSLNGLPSRYQLLHSFFMSVTSRTAGFNYIDVTILSEPTFLFIIVFMFIGVAPQGTGGGIKITTFVLMVKYLISSFRGQNRVYLFGSMIARASIGNAIKLYLLSTTFILLMSFMLLLSFSEQNYIKILFECVSAFTTTGLSTGLTNVLSTYGKFILILCMFIGRVNLLNVGASFFPSFQNNLKTHDDGEKLQIG